MAKKDQPTLDEFAAAQPDPRKNAWSDTLPEDIRQQITDSTASSLTVVKWLHSIGYPEATYSKVDHWRRQARQHGRRPQ